MTMATVPESEHRPTPIGTAARWWLLAVGLACAWPLVAAEDERNGRRRDALAGNPFGPVRRSAGPGGRRRDRAGDALSGARRGCGAGDDEDRVQADTGAFHQEPVARHRQQPGAAGGSLHFPGTAGWSELSTRVRVDSYTHVRAIAETNDGALHMAANYVKASGGCSAPSSKDPAAAEAQLGRMKLRLPETVKAGEPLRMQILIKHPNSSGLQFDQVAAPISRRTTSS